ncbi:MAG TPA: hypothetical protein VGC57_08110 [Cellulomonas sp.]
MDRGHPAGTVHGGRGPSAPPIVAPDRALEAELAAARHLDPRTGLARTPSLRSALGTLAGTGSTARPVLLVALSLGDLGTMARREGAEAAWRLHRSVGRGLLLAGSGPEALHAFVAPGGPGRFVVQVAGDAATSLAGREAAVERVRRVALDGLAAAGTPPRAPAAAPVVTVAAFCGPAGAGLVDAVLACLDGRDPAAGAGMPRGVPTLRVVPSQRGAAQDPDRQAALATTPATTTVLGAEPVVSSRSGRLRALHLRLGTARRPVQVDEDTLCWMVERTVQELDRWPTGLTDVLEHVWVDAAPSAIMGDRLRRTVARVWSPGRPRLGLRVAGLATGQGGGTADRSGALSAARALARVGADLALCLDGDADDPARVDTEVFREVVVAAPLLAAATRRRADEALVSAPCALATWLGALPTVDGVDDRDRLRVAARLGAWYVEGELFGPVRPLAEAGERWTPSTDLRGPWASAPLAPASASTASPRAADGPVDGELEPELRELVAWWWSEAITPAHVRHRLNALRRYGRWTLAEASAAMLDVHAARLGA